MLTSLLGDKLVNQKIKYLGHLFNKIISSPCKSLKATSFTMLDEKKMKVKVVVEAESIRHVYGSGAAADLGVTVIDQFPLISPMYKRLL